MKTILTSVYQNSKTFTFILLFIFSLSFHSETYSTPVPKLKEFPAPDLKMFEGSYQLIGNQNSFIKISAYGDQLTLKELWSNREFSFTHKSELSFTASGHPEFTLDFAQDKSGTINQVVAFKRDVWVKVKPKEAPAKLSPAETKKLSTAYQTVFTAFEEAINSNSDEKILTFLKTYMDESVLAAITIEHLTLQAKEIYQNTGGIDRVTQNLIDPATGTTTYKGKKNGNVFKMSFALNMEGKIINFSLQE